MYMLPGIVFAIPGGLIGQRFGDKRVAILGLALMTVGGAWLGIADGYWSAFFSRLVSGVGGVVLNVIMAKMVADWFAGREITVAMAYLLSSWPIGLGLALVLLGPLAAWTSITFALSFSGLVSGMALIATAALYRSPPNAVQAVPSFRIQLSGREWALTLVAGLIWTLFNVAIIIVVAFGPSLLTAHGYGVAEAGALVSLTTWVLVPALPLGGYIAMRINRPAATTAFCFVGCAVVMSALPLGLAPALLFASLGLLFGPPGGLIMKLPADVLDARNRAAGMGIYFACYYAGMAALTPVAGLLRDTTGSASAPLLFGGAVMFAGALTLALFRALQRSSAT